MSKSAKQTADLSSLANKECHVLQPMLDEALAGSVSRIEAEIGDDQISFVANSASGSLGSIKWLWDYHVRQAVRRRRLLVIYLCLLLGVVAIAALAIAIIRMGRADLGGLIFSLDLCLFVWLSLGVHECWGWGPISTLALRDVQFNDLVTVLSTQVWAVGENYLYISNVPERRIPYSYIGKVILDDGSIEIRDQIDRNIASLQVDGEDRAGLAREIEVRIERDRSALRSWKAAVEVSQL